MPRFEREFTQRLVQKARDTFTRDDEIRCFVAPGRVNLIGEHTDYNDGFVLPAALELALVALMAPRDDGKVVAVSIDESPDDEFDLGSISKLPDGQWSNYVRGVVLALQDQGGDLGGFTMVVGSTIPVGSGLSSSAAIEVATGFGLGKLYGPPIPRPDLAILCQRVENEFVGVNCGIMDQFIVANAKEDHALFLDCRTLSSDDVPIPTDLAVIVCDTHKPRTLAGSKYNERRAECEEAVRAMATIKPSVSSLRDADPELLAKIKDKVSDDVYRRARHVIGENRRVLESVRALNQGDAAAFGRLMNESHASLRDDYEVSCHELDVMVEICQGVEGVLGSRMTGAGFGGCAVTLARAEAAGQVERAVLTEYPKRASLKASVYRSRASAGVKEEDPDKLLGGIWE
ncbi:MAG: galactokinase [Armatimonadia bacterium]|nr:galactokinase [Armatimonadia bacterium]